MLALWAGDGKVELVVHQALFRVIGETCDHSRSITMANVIVSFLAKSKAKLRMRAPRYKQRDLEHLLLEDRGRGVALDGAAK